MLIIIEIIALFLLLGLSALFSGSETSYFSLSPVQKEQIAVKKNHKSSKILYFIANPSQFLVGILSGNMIVNITATVIVTSLMTSMFPDKGAEITIPIMTVLLLLFGEITPKIIAAHWNMRFAYAFVELLSIVLKILRPITFFMEKLANLIGTKNYSREELSETDLKMAVEILRSNDNWNPDVVRALMGVLELDRVPITYFMIPIEQIPIVASTDIIGNVRKQFTNLKMCLVNSDSKITGILESASLVDADNTDEISEYSDTILKIKVDTNPGAFLHKVFTSGIKYGLIMDDKTNPIGVIDIKNVIKALISEELTGELK